jgi:hypothetical protein
MVLGATRATMGPPLSGCLQTVGPQQAVLVRRSALGVAPCLARRHSCYGIAGATLTLLDCQLTANTAGSVGGGLVNYNGGTVTLNGSSVSDNTAGITGGGIDNVSGTVTLENSTVSDNHPDNCVGAITGNGCA